MKFPKRLTEIIAITLISTAAVLVFTPTVFALELCRAGDTSYPSYKDPSPANAGIFIYPNGGAQSAYIKDTGGGEGIVNIGGFSQSEAGGYRCFLERRDRETAAAPTLPFTEEVNEAPEAPGEISYNNVCLDIVEGPDGPCLIGGRDNGQFTGGGGIIACFDSGGGAIFDSWYFSSASVTQPGTTGADPYRSGFLFAGDSFDHPLYGQAIAAVGVARDNPFETDAFVSFSAEDVQWTDLFDFDGVDINESFDSYNEVAFGPDGNVYVSGTVTRQTASGPDTVMVVKKYRAVDGLNLWGSLGSYDNTGAPSTEIASAFFVHENSAGEFRVIQAGWTSNMPGLNVPAWIIIARDSSGDFLWQSYLPRQPGSFPYTPSGITVSLDGDYLIAGQSADPVNADLPAYTIIKLNPSNGNLDEIEFYDGPLSGPFGEGAFDVTTLGTNVVASGFASDPTATVSNPKLRFQTAAFDDELTPISTKVVQQSTNERYASTRKVIRDDPYFRAWVFGGATTPAGAYFWSRPYELQPMCTGEDDPLFPITRFDGSHLLSPELIDMFCTGMGCSDSRGFNPSDFSFNFEPQVFLTPDRAPLDLTIRRADFVQDIISPKITIAVYDATDNQLLDRMEFEAKRTMLHGRLGIPDLPVGSLRVEVFVDLEKDGTPDLFGSVPVSITQKGIVTQREMILGEVPPGKTPPLTSVHD